MRDLAAMMVKELHQIRRDVRALAILLFFPTLLLLFLGYVISMDVEHVSLVVLDEDGSDMSRSLVDRMTAYDDIVLAERASSPAGMEDSVFRGRARIGLHIPVGFEREVLSGRRVAVQAVVDGTNSLIAQAASRILASHVYATNLELRSLAPSRPGAALAPIVPVVRLYYNPELRSTVFLIPGLVAFILALAGTLATSLSIVREKERGTIEQIALSPLPSWRFIVGKTVPYMAISIVSAALILASGRFLFGLPMRGDPLVLAVSTVLFLLCSLGLGLLISSITDSQQVAYTVSALLTLLPTFLLSGFVFPIRNMPLAIQAITYAVPARYYIRILRTSLLQGAGWDTVTWDTCMLGLLGLVLLGAATIKLRRGGLAP